MFSLFAKDQTTTNPATSATSTGPAIEQEPAPTGRRAVRPAVDLVETATGIELTADMPGVDQSGIEVRLERGVLTIRGTNRCTRPKDFTALHREYEPVDYMRSFALGDTIDQAAIGATIRDGVLRVTLPTASAAQARRIQVSAN